MSSKGETTFQKGVNIQEVIFLFANIRRYCDKFPDFKTMADQ